MCRFAPRCPVAVEASHCSSPDLVEVEPGHLVRCHLYAVGHGAPEPRWIQEGDYSDCHRPGGEVRRTSGTNVLREEKTMSEITDMEFPPGFYWGAGNVRLPDRGSGSRRGEGRVDWDSSPHPWEGREW